MTPNISSDPVRGRRERRPDVVCLGETMVLVAPDPPVALLHASSCRLSHGGAESNLAVYLARLGSHASWCSRVGDDVLGERLLSEISAEGVATDLVRTGAGRTGVYFKDPDDDGTRVLYYREASAASKMDLEDVDRALAAQPKFLHLSGITPALSPSCRRSVAYAMGQAASLGVKVSFDVNLRLGLWPDLPEAAAVLRQLAQQADVVFVGLDEAETLWRVARCDDVRAILDRPPVVVVKESSAGAWSYEGRSRCHVGALPVEVVEPVGAGDAFAAGWLHGLLTGMSWVERLRLGHLVAATSLLSATDHGDLIGGPTVLERLARSGEPWSAEGASFSP